MTTDDLAGYTALALTPGIGPARLRTLLDATENPDGALSAPFAFLCSLPGFSRAAATAVRNARRADGERTLVAAAAAGSTVLAPFDRRYPALLRDIPDPPAILFAAGNLALLDRPAVAIVGSRDHSVYGAQVCSAVAGRASALGLVVVSGMARGLDALAHAAALDAALLDGAAGSIGVLGNGLGVVYPAANRALYERMRAHGLLLTEFPPGERPHAGSFPRRNRLISGLARATIVIEARAGSGTMITVATALEQGRDVLAVPGPITSALSVGTNRLIRDGATPLLEIDDLAALYPEVKANALSAKLAQSTVPQESALAGRAAATSVLVPDVQPLPDDLAGDERRIAVLIGPNALHIDELAERTKRPVMELLAILSTLEIRGIVRQEPGRLFRR